MTQEKKTIVVFGGAGFVGSHLLRKLSREGRFRLVSADLKEPKFRSDGVDYLTADVRDLSSFEPGGSIELIYNLAAIHTTPGHAVHEYYETNIAGATQITAFAARKAVETILFTSSISVYGPSEDLKTEATPPAPESAYGWSKWLSEGIHRAWLDGDAKRRLVICRPAVIFGHAEGGNFTRLAGLLKKGIFIYPGRKDTIKACFYVEDLLAAFDYALSLNQRSILFNGCYPDRYTLEQIIETFRQEQFGTSRTFMVPKSAVVAAAKALKPISAAGLGIHPDRVMKLIRSTDILPSWLEENGMAVKGKLPSAIRRWYAESASFK